MNKELRYNLVEYLGVATGRFNSGFSSDMEYEDVTNSKRTTKMFTWFLPPALQFPNGYETEIGEWRVSEKALEDKNIQFEEVGTPPHSSKEKTLFLPKAQTTAWEKLTSLYGPPQSILKGYLTPSGRSFWVTGSDQRCFGLKFHIRGRVREDLLMEKALDLTMISNSVIVNQKLRDDPNVMNEFYGCFMTLNSAGEAPLEAGYLYRDFKWDQIKASEGDVFLPLTALLSQTLWSSEELRLLLSLPKPPFRMSDWFVSELAPHFAEAIENSLFRSGIHPEFHQQNLTIHMRQGKVVRVIYQDLQDCLYDPITRFLICTGRRISKETPTEDLEIRRLLALPGEILTTDNFDKLSVQLSDWWRRWLRMFGRYDRIINMLSGENLFESCRFETAIANQLRSTCEHLKLNIEAAATMDLYQLIGAAQHAFQQKLLNELLQRSELEEGKDLPIFEKGISLATARAPWTRSLFEKFLAKENAKPLKFTQLNDKFLIVSGAEESHLYYFREV